MSIPNFNMDPYPSHVFAPSFVTVKLSGRGMYDLWRKQMLCLLESHDMLGFINGSTVVAPGTHDDCHKLWKRSDSLVQGWILGSLSELVAMRVLHHLKSTQHQNMNNIVTAKDIWDQLQMMHDHQQATEVSIGGGGGSFHYDNLEKMTKKEKDRAKTLEEVYLATERGKWKELSQILEKTKVEITEKISINGHTALHIAIVSKSAKAHYLLDNMLKSLPNDVSLLKIRNYDGSTLLHTAARLGRTRAAKVLLKKSPQLLFEKDKKNRTPLDVVLANPKDESCKDMCVYLLTEYSTAADLEQHGIFNNFANSEEPLITAISYKHFGLAMFLIKKYDTLKSDAVLMAIVEHWPTHFNLCESIVHELLEKPIMNSVTKLALDYDCCRKLHSRLTKFKDCVIKRAGAWIDSPCKTKFAETVLKNLSKKATKRRQDAVKLLNTVCGIIKFSTCESCYPHFYSKPCLEAIRRDAWDVVEIMAFWFPNAYTNQDEDGHNIAQVAWKNRALKVLALSVTPDISLITDHFSFHQETGKDPFGNTFLHFAARLAPDAKLNLISGPPFKLQRELQWFKKAKEILPRSIMKKNCFEETPDMVFTKEHKELLTEGREWMKTTANSYILTATLIITIVFAAAITIPGGNKEQDGFPRFEDHPSFVVFATSIAASMVTAATSLLLFLWIMTSRFAEQDFKLKLPLLLVIGLLNLFISATFMILAFGAAWFLMFWKKRPWTLSLIALLVGQPIVFFAIYQSRLGFDLLVSTMQFRLAYLLARVKALDRVLI